MDFNPRTFNEQQTAATLLYLRQERHRIKDDAFQSAMSGLRVPEAVEALIRLASRDPGSDKPDSPAEASGEYLDSVIARPMLVQISVFVGKLT